MLGPVSTVEGFDVFWEAAETVAGLAPPSTYPHHRLGDPSMLAELATSCGWEVDRVEPIVSRRVCDGDELWRWLWGSLPLLRHDGSFVEGPDRAALESPIRREFCASAQRWRTGPEPTARYCVPSLALMLLLLIPVFCLAYLSWRFVERPFRNRQATSFITTAIFGLATTAIIIIIGHNPDANSDRKKSTGESLTLFQAIAAKTT